MPDIRSLSNVSGDKQKRFAFRCLVIMFLGEMDCFVLMQISSPC